MTNPTKGKRACTRPWRWVETLPSGTTILRGHVHTILRRQTRRHRWASRGGVATLAAWGPTITWKMAHTAEEISTEGDANHEAWKEFCRQHAPPPQP